MARRKVSNLLALAVLSLLNERPMHPYEIATVMRQRELSSVIKLNFGSLYSTIEALQREELIAPLETQREGRYPERTVYTTTEAGRAELHDWLRSLLREPTPEYTPFGAALAFLVNLSPDEVIALIEEHLRHLVSQVTGLRSLIEQGLSMGVDRLFLVEDNYAAALLEARSAFLQQLIREMRDGTLTETRDGKLVWKVLRPELGLLQGWADPGEERP